jgi:TrwC relaxase
VALLVKALKASQEAYWLDQIARNREVYFSGRGESPGRFVGSAAGASGLDGVASPEQVRAMFQGLDPATDEVRCARLSARAEPDDPQQLANAGKVTAHSVLNSAPAFACRCSAWAWLVSFRSARSFGR